MKKLPTTILATALVAAISMTAFTTSANANNNRNGHGPRAAGPVHFVCAENGAERIENGLSRMATRLDLTEEQSAAFEDFKSASLSAQEDFAQACDEFKPAQRGQAQNGDEVDLIDRMNNRQSMMAAQLSAMQSVMPDLEKFFDSLTDEQKHQMRPHRGARNGAHTHGPGNPNGEHSHGPKGANAPAMSNEG